MTDLLVAAQGQAVWRGKTLRCALGRTGVIPALSKREGDGKTPLGSWPMRRVLFRNDRLKPPLTRLPVQIISEHDGWCDASSDPGYNQFVQHPYPASAEHLWRDDHVYDVIVPLGYNDAPVLPGMGSAIFLHCAQPDYAPTAGCVALALQDLLMVLETASVESRVIIDWR